MKKALKWSLLIGGGFFLLIIVLLVLAPFFLERYRAPLEQWGSELIGRPLTIQGPIKLKLVPSFGLKFSGLHIGNPEGFGEKDFVAVKAFELRVRLFPLFKKELHIERFMIEEPVVHLVKTKQGRPNWQDLGPEKKKTGSPTPAAKPQPSNKPGPAELPIRSLAIDEFHIKEAMISGFDHQTGQQWEVKHLNLELKEVSFDRPIKIFFSARINNQPLEILGRIGPVGREPGKSPIPLDLLVKALNTLEMKIKGKLSDPMGQPQVDLALETSHFSAKRLVRALGREFPLKTSRPEALDDLALSAKIKGGAKEIALSEGLFHLDQSRFKFSARIDDFSRPNIRFDGHLDQINLDHYLPPAEEKKSGSAAKPAEPPAQKTKTDYGPLRRLILNAQIRIDKLTVQKTKVAEVLCKVIGKNGIFLVDPWNLKLYQGTLNAKARLDVSQDAPDIQTAMQIKEVQAGPLVRDLLGKDIIEGKLQADLDLRTKGAEVKNIKQNLNGKGDLLFKDGAIVGIDLQAMIQNVKAAFGLAEAAQQKPRTVFSEFRVPFNITNGLFETKETALLSSAYKVKVLGKADLAAESLDFRIEPTVAGVIKGDDQKRKGVTVPVILSGTFTDPKFRPDLEGMLKKGVKDTLSDPNKLQQLLKGGDKKEKKKPIEDLLKGLISE